jgi:acetone carboxylase beta subunit
MATYLVSEVSVIAQVDTLKPLVQRHELQDKKPPKSAEKGTRQVFENGQWLEANLFEMDELKPGNEIKGLAVIEAPSTTLHVPSGLTARFDEHEIIWLEKGGSE